MRTYPCASAAPSSPDGRKVREEIFQKNSHIKSLNHHQSSAFILPARGNRFSLSQGERAGVRAGFLIFHRSDIAFSLIEVMVAIFILAIALTGLTAGITTALNSSKESELQTTAALFASGQIELLRAQTDWMDGTKQGDCGATLPLYRWRQTVSSTDINGLHEIDVVVENSRTGQEIYELKTMLFEIPENPQQQKGNSAPAKGNQT
jgi:prepilin-type N-terminal cleavage/methylation domain-containing protein